jgi:hypothetical protein
MMDDGISLDLDERLIVDQLGNLDHGRRRADRFEELAVERREAEGLVELAELLTLLRLRAEGAAGTAVTPKRR